MKTLLKKYSFLFFLIIINLIILIYDPKTGKESLAFTGKNFVSFLFMLTPVFICMGLIDVWVERDTMVKIMGKESGVKGILISFFFGVITAVPFYALLPLSVLLLKKGSKIKNVLIFICSSTSIRIPLLLFEVSSMGWRYMLVRLFLNIFLVLIIAFLIENLLTEKDKENIYSNAADF